MVVLKFGLGFLMLLFGLGYLYFPKLISAVNSFMRRYIFNDAFLILHRRRVGALTVFASLLFLYMGFSSLQKEQQIILPGMSITEGKLYNALHLIRTQKYNEAIKICEEIIGNTDPNNVRAYTRAGLAYFLKGEKRKARLYWEKGLRIEPGNKELQSLIRSFE